MEVVKGRKGNPKHRFYRSSKFPEGHISKQFSEISEIQENGLSLRGVEWMSEKLICEGTLRVSPCGNLVDGLPHDCHGE